MTQHIWRIIRVFGFIAGWFICSTALGILNFVVSASIDYSIAERIGGVSDIPENGSLFAGGRVFGGIEWTYSSFFGPLMTLFGAPGMLAGFLIIGLFFWLIVWKVVAGTQRRLGRYYWLVFANVAVWLLRFPVPTEYSLFYWTAIKY